MIGRIIRTISIKEEKPTLQEVELKDLRDHANVQREIACVNDFQRMGYERQSD